MKKSKDNEKWLIALGQHLAKLIEEKGYSSPYEFWVEAGEETISRGNLHNILNGNFDIKITTLRKFASLLDIKLTELLDFE